MPNITIRCPHCSQRYGIDESFEGRPIECIGEKCGKSFTAKPEQSQSLPINGADVVDSARVEVSSDRVDQILGRRKQSPKKPPEIPPEIPVESPSVIVPSDKQSKPISMSKNQFAPFMAVLIAILGFQVASAVRSSLRTWEYKIESPDDFSFEKRMNEFGKDGWELVSARRATSRIGNDASYEVILKRTK